MLIIQSKTIVIERGMWGPPQKILNKIGTKSALLDTSGWYAYLVIMSQQEVTVESAHYEMDLHIETLYIHK